MVDILDNIKYITIYHYIYHYAMLYRVVLELKQYEAIWSNSQIYMFLRCLRWLAPYVYIFLFVCVFIWFDREVRGSYEGAMRELWEEKLYYIILTMIVLRSFIYIDIDYIGIMLNHRCIMCMYMYMYIYVYTYNMCANMCECACSLNTYI